MTPYMNPLAMNGLPSRWPALFTPHAVAPRTGLGVRPQRLTAKVVLVVALEAVVVLGTVQVMAGIGRDAQAGWAPTPGGVAPVGQGRREAPLHEFVDAEAAPAPLQAPGPLPLPLLPMQPR